MLLTNLIFFLLFTLIGNVESSAVNKPCPSYPCDDHTYSEDDVSGSGND